MNNEYEIMILQILKEDQFLWRKNWRLFNFYALLKLLLLNKYKYYSRILLNKIYKNF
jgi:hypothetical protein